MTDVCIRCELNAVCYDGLPGLCKPCSEANAEEMERWSASMKDICAKIRTMTRLQPKS